MLATFEWGDALMWIFVGPIVAGILSGTFLLIFWAFGKIRNILTNKIPSWRKEKEETEKQLKQLEEIVRLEMIGEDYITYWANKERLPKWLDESSLMKAGLNEIRAGLILKTGSLFLHENKNMNLSKKEEILKAMKELWNHVIVFNTVTERGKIQDDNTPLGQADKIWADLEAILSGYNETSWVLTNEKIEALAKQALLMPTGFPIMNDESKKGK